MSEKKKSTTKAKKPESKSKKVKSTQDAAADSKSVKPSDEVSESGSAGYSIGENQKAVTESYRKGWDSIFSKKD
jgi:hypothetical protein